MIHLHDKFNYENITLREEINDIKNEYKKMELNYLNLQDDISILINKIKTLESFVYTSHLSLSPVNTKEKFNEFTCINMDECLEKEEKRENVLENEKEKEIEEKEENRVRSRSIPWDTTIKTLFG